MSINLGILQLSCIENFKHFVYFTNLHKFKIYKKSKNKTINMINFDFKWSSCCSILSFRWSVLQIIVWLFVLFIMAIQFTTSEYPSVSSNFSLMSSHLQQRFKGVVMICFCLLLNNKICLNIICLLKIYLLLSFLQSEVSSFFNTYFVHVKTTSLELLRINELSTYIQSLVGGFLDLYF